MEAPLPCLMLQDAGAPLLPKFYNIKAEISGFLVGLDIILKYSSDNDAPANATFCFPLKDTYFLLRAEAILNGQRIKTVVKRNNGKNRLNSATAATSSVAAYQRDEHDDLIVFCLGNISAGAEVDIHLELAGELMLTEKTREAKFILPTFTKKKRSEVVPIKCSFGMVVKALYVAEVSSPTHVLAVDKSKDFINVSLSNEACACIDDLVILIQQSEDFQVSYELGGSAMQGPSSNAQDYLMQSPVIMVSHVFQPIVDNPANELIFLVDCSKSMKGSSLLNVKKALAVLLKSIPVDCIFNIFTFGSTFSSLFKKSAEYNQESLQEAVKHIQSLKADLGEADLLSLIKHILGLFPAPSFSRQVFILTAGFVADIRACIDEVSHNAKKCRMYTYGFGASGSKELIQGLAAAGRGSATFISEDERVQVQVTENLKRSLEPSMTLIKAKFDAPPEFEIAQTPSKIPPVLAGHRLMLYGVLKNKTNPGAEVQSRIQGVASVDGQVAGLKGQDFDAGVGHTYAFAVKPSPLESPDKSEEVSQAIKMPLVHYFAATSLLNDWKQDNSFTNPGSPSNKQECIDLSVSSGVICEHTNFEVVGEDEKSVEGALCCILPHDVQKRTSFHEEVKPRKGLLGAMKSFYKSVTSQASKTDDVSDWYFALDAITSLQHAAGYWSLKDLSEISNKELQHKTVSEEVWATLLTLSLLEKKYERSEWELMALKAEKWLSKQELPGDLDSLRSAASLCVI